MIWLPKGAGRVTNATWQDMGRCNPLPLQGMGLYDGLLAILFLGGLCPV